MNYKNIKQRRTVYMPLSSRLEGFFLGQWLRKEYCRLILVAVIWSIIYALRRRMNLSNSCAVCSLVEQGYCDFIHYSAS